MAIFDAQWYQQQIPGEIADQQSKQLGITNQQLYQMYAQQAASNPSSAPDWRTTQSWVQNASAPYASNNAASSYGTQPVQNAPAIIGQAQQYLNFQRSLGGGGQQAPQDTSGLVYKTGAQNPAYALNLLGAQALSKVGMNPSNTMTVNPTPADTPSSKDFAKTGVSAVGQPKNYDISGQPMPQNTGTPSLFNPATAVASTQSQTPAVMPAAQPTAAPGGATYAPWAQAPGQPPAAPGGAPSIAEAQANHFSGLANAGMALYSHYGGDPGSATPADIANFHSELQGAMRGGPPIKMRSGGLVPGRGNQDTVPALLTPGEYVVPKDQVPQLFGGRAPARMADGGFVTDDSNQPPEERRKAIATSGYAAPASSGQQPSQQPPSSSSPATTPGGTQQGPAFQGYAARTPNYLETRADPDPDMPYLRQAGYSPSQATSIASDYSGQSPGNIPGIGGVTPNAAGAIGGLASGLSAAAKAYADSIKPWQMQSDAVAQHRFGPPAAPSGPAAQFTQQQIQQPQQQRQYNPYGMNPYAMGLV